MTSDKDGYTKSIFPCRTDTTQGTAFYVGDKKLLTARHVVLDILFQNVGEWAYIEVDGKSLKCKAKEIKDLNNPKDVALLEITDDIGGLDLRPLTLTVTEHHQHRDLTVVGFPQEVFAGKTCVVLKFKERIELTLPHPNYDDLITISDDLELSSYEGISGSPVLNGVGSVVGIVTYQHNHMIGYVPVKNISFQLTTFGITAKGDSFKENDMPYGNYTAKTKLEESKDKVATRYKKELHQSLKGLTDIEEYFTNTEKETECHGLAKQIKEWANSIGAKEKADSVVNFCKFIKNSIKDSKSDDVFIDMCARERLGQDIKDSTARDKYVQLHRQSVALKDYLELIYSKFVYIAAYAGMGKTHGMCHLADSLISDSNVYLMFGTDFSSGKTAKNTFLDYYGFKEDDIKEIDELHRGRKHKALIIIDALNEGAGNAYWSEQMDSLIQLLKPCENIKLLVTYRKNLESEFNCFKGGCWHEWKLQGFEDRGQAIEDYCKEYEIAPTMLDDTLRDMFGQPLFLSAFCEAYKGGAHFDSSTLNKLILFKRYIKVRNENVSKICGEDPCRNVTQQILSEIARISVTRNQCDIVNRDDARAGAESISPNRLWEHHLLNACLQENLLLPITRPEDRHFVMFEYEEIGDYLKADAFLSKVWDEKERWKAYIQLSKDIFGNKDANKDKFSNFNIALFKIWELKDLSEDLISDIKQMDGIKSVLEEMGASDNEKIKEAYATITSERPLAPAELVTNAMSLSEVSMKAQHHFLMEMKLAERDFKWTTFVNSHDETSTTQFYAMHPGSEEYATEQQRLVWIQSWMLTSSYPEVRIPLVRSLVSEYAKNHELIKYCLDLFADVNDPYIIKGILCAVYGMLLTCRDKTVIEDAVNAVHYAYKDKGAHWTDDIQSRQWLLHIFEFGFMMSPDKCPYWHDITFPVSEMENPFDRSKDINIMEGMFGNEVGAQRLYLSLCGSSDFNRYVLGTNDHSELYHFSWNGKPEEEAFVMINDVIKAMVHIIKSELGWNETLAQYDAKVPHTGRFEQPQERIGKKYQWLSLHKVIAYLTDHCRIEREDYNENGSYYDQSYPWFCRYADTFDPSLPLKPEKTCMDFREQEIAPTYSGTSQGWIDDDTILPALRLFREDADGRKWINLGASLTDNVSHGEDSLNTFVFYNCFLVDDKDVEVFSKWAENQSFGGRWMPELSGQTEFLWNEYPWSSSFKDRNYPEDAGYVGNDCPCTLYHASFEQLQENLDGIPDADNYPSRACAPNASMMETLSLYTAERGVVRRTSDDSVVAVNCHTSTIQDASLWMLDSELQQYLLKAGRTLAIVICGEKSATQPGYKSLGVKDYTGCYLYTGDGEIKTIQELKIEQIQRTTS